MTLRLHLRHQVTLTAFINLNLPIQICDLLFMFSLSSFKFLDVINVNLLSIFKQSCLPISKCLILHKFIYTLYRSKQECLGLPLSFNKVSPCMEAILLHHMTPHPTEPMNLASDVFESFDFLNFLLIIIECIF